MKLDISQFKALLGIATNDWRQAALERGILTDDLIAKLRTGWEQASDKLDQLPFDATDEQIEQASTVEVPMLAHEERILKDFAQVILDEMRGIVNALDSIGKWRQE